MEVNSLNQADIARIIGAQRSRITEFFQGIRCLTTEQIAKLSMHFAVSSDLFISKDKFKRTPKASPKIKQRKSSIAA
jgi:plasmid maintenance system antidote protein VapI